MISGPGSGKSVLAAELFVEMKKQGYNVEFLQEYAKKLVWQKQFDVLNNQHLVSRKYYESMVSMNDIIDYVILDSSLLNGLYYNRNNLDNLSNVDKTEKYIIENYQTLNNINIFINRGNFKFEKEGRLESELESKAIDANLLKILDHFNIVYHIIDVEDPERIKKIIGYLPPQQ